MIRAIRIADTDDVSHEAVANDLVPRSLPSFTGAVLTASGITVHRGAGNLTHLKCIVDSPVISISETPFTNAEFEETLTITLRVNNSTISNSKICVDYDSKQLVLLVISNASLHWVVWRFPQNDRERLLSGFPIGDGSSIFQNPRSFLFGSLTSNASISSSTACLIPSTPEPLAFFAIAFDNARVLVVRAPVFSGSESSSFEHCFIEPTSLLSRIMSYASSSQTAQSILSLDCFFDSTSGISGLCLLRSTQQVELYAINSKKRLSSCMSGPATYTSSGTPLLARIMETDDVRFVGVLHRDAHSLKMTLCKASLLPKLSLSATCDVKFSLCSPNMSVIDIGLLKSAVFLACQTPDGTPICCTVPVSVEGDSLQVMGDGSNINYWRRPITNYSDDESLGSETEMLTHSVLSADCGSLQLLRQLLQALRLPHMGLINGSVVSAGISAALSARQALAAEMSTSGLNETNSRIAVEGLSRKIENIWAKDRKILGVNVCYAKNFALIYHRHSVTAIVPSAHLLSMPKQVSSFIDQNELLERVASAFYNNILSSPDGAYLSMFSSLDAVSECSASFLLTLDDDLRYAVENAQFSKFDPVIEALLGPSLNVDSILPKCFAFEMESFGELSTSTFPRRMIARLVLSNLDWLLSYTVALISLQPNETAFRKAERLAQFAVMLRNLRTLLETPMPLEELSPDEILTSSSLTWLTDSFVEYALASSSVLMSFVGDSTPNVTSLGSILTKLLLPQNSSFLFEQFLLDNSLFPEFETLQRCIGSANNYPAASYRLYLYGLCALLRNQNALSMEYFIDAALQISPVDAKLLAERCRPHIARIEKPEADFWVRILDLAQHFGSVDVAIEAAVRAKSYFIDNQTFSTMLDMKLFKLQCQAFNFRGAISTMLNMSVEEDMLAAVNVIASTAILESKLVELIDCLLIDMSDYSNEKINSLVASALHRALRSGEFPDWQVCWSLYRMNLGQNRLREAASALFEYYARLPSLSCLSPIDFTRRRDALALAYCTLKMVFPPSEQWISSFSLRSSSENSEGTEIVVTLADLDELCRIEDARVELIMACELPEGDDGMDCDKFKRFEKLKPKFEEAAPIILRLGASDLVRWLSTAQLFSAATELCRALLSPSRDISAPLVDALCNKVDGNGGIVHENDLKACLLRLNDCRPTFNTIRNLYNSDLDLPGWLWRFAVKLDSDSLLRATIKHKRLADAGRITVFILESAMKDEMLKGEIAFSSSLPWWQMDRVVSALREFVRLLNNNPQSEQADGSLEIVDIYARIQALSTNYARHAENVKRRAASAMMP